MTLHELVDSLRAEITEHMESIRHIADQIEALSAPSPHLHWLSFPLDYRPIRVTGEFGERYTVGAVTWQHEGVDLSVPVGMPVYAAASGQVVMAETRRGYGLCVRVQHVRNGERWWTWYAHLSLMHCTVGDMVDAGQLIALSGNSGNTTGPHLHLTVQREDDRTLPAGCAEILRGCVNPREFVQWPG